MKTIYPAVLLAAVLAAVSGCGGGDSDGGAPASSTISSQAVSVSSVSSSSETPSSAAISSLAHSSDGASSAVTHNFNVVDTAQDACYDAKGAPIPCPAPGTPDYGQDAQHTGHAPSYSDNTDRTVTDNVTGIMWEKSPDTNGDSTINIHDKMTYPQAQNHCADLALGGHDDWQLPTIKQLYSLISFRGIDAGVQFDDPTGLKPFINADVFDFAFGDTANGERVIDMQYATDTLYVDHTANDGGNTLFGVNFADGRIKGYGLKLHDEDKTFSVLCARDAESYGTNHFTDNGDGTITDHATGLMWEKEDSANGLNWGEALNSAVQKNGTDHLGYNDWRVPNAKELHSILDYTRAPTATGSAAINAMFTVSTITNEAGDVDYPAFWSSTTHVTRLPRGPGMNAIYISFGRAMGKMNGNWVDVHGAGAQRSDPKTGNAEDFPDGRGPQGDAVRIDNYVRLVRDVNN